MNTPPNPPHPDRLTLALLRLGVAVPFLYYGLQLLVAPFYPGYSFVGQAASELGSDLAPPAARAFFNAGIMLQGAVSLLAAAGFARALLRLRRVHPAIAWLTGAAAATSGVQSLWAGAFPMPDPRHGGHPLFVAAMLALPVLLTLSLWRDAGRPLRTYFAATLLLLLCMVPLMSGVAARYGVDTASYRGLLQRVFTLAIFPPVAVAAGALARAVRRG